MWGWPRWLGAVTGFPLQRDGGQPQPSPSQPGCRVPSRGLGRSPERALRNLGLAPRRLVGGRGDQGLDPSGPVSHGKRVIRQGQTAGGSVGSATGTGGQASMSPCHSGSTSWMHMVSSKSQPLRALGSHLRLTTLSGWNAVTHARAVGALGPVGWSEGACSAGLGPRPAAHTPPSSPPGRSCPTWCPPRSPVAREWTST